MTYGELKMKSTQVILAGFGALWFLSAGAVRAQTPAEPAAAPEGQEEVSKSEASPADAPKSLEEKVEELDQKIRVLDRKAEIDKEAEAEKAKTGAQATANAKDGFSLKSNDGAFLLKLRGYVQLDGRFFSDDRARPATDTFILRRVRPILEGTVFGKFDFRIMPDFGAGTTVLQDAYLDARFTPFFKVRAGKFKVPVGLERLQSGSDILFVERGFPTNLVPNRDLGIQVHGDLATGTVNYQVGVFNGVPDGASADVDSDSGKDVAARLFFQPFVNGVSAAKNFGFGLAASSGSPSGTVSSPGLASYKTPGQQTFFSYRTDGTAAGTTIAKGDRQRLSPQLSWYTGSFGVLAEWVSSKQEVARGAAQAQVESTAWEVSASWVLGGTASYKGVSPKKVFDPASKGWGALELKARAGRQEIDDKAFPIFADPTKSASSAKEWGVGLNWILNRAVKVQLDYENTTFERGAVSGDRPDEKVLLSRFQVSF